MANKPDNQSFVRELGFVDATMIVVGSMVGSGIFIVSAEVARLLGGAGWVLVAWGIAGVITLIGALSYGELAGMMPKVGGQFIYLKEAYNDLVAFLFGWCTFLVIQTGTIAAVAVAFARYTGVLIPFFDEKNILISIGSFGISSTQLLAVFSIILLTVINLRGVKEAKFIQLILTLVKIVAMGGLIVLGISIGLKKDTLLLNWVTAWNSYTTLEVDGLLNHQFQIEGFTLWSTLGLALVGPLFSSSSWNNITFTASEIKDPARDIPRSLFWGTLLVTAIYLALNVVYQMLLPVQGLPNATDTLGRGIMFAQYDRVGTAAAEVIFGNAGTIIMAIFIMISTFGCNNGIILAGARVYYAMAKEKLFFEKIGTLSKNGVPANALILQSIWACLLCLSGTYGKLLDYTIFTILIFYIITILGVFILRKKQPNAPRPYKAFGYPILPAIYLLVTTAIAINLLIFKPETSLAGLVIVAIGVVVFYVRKK